MPIEQSDLGTLDNIYVRKEDCNDFQKSIEKQINTSITDLALINRELVWIKWLLFASLGERILTLFGGKFPPM